MFSQQQEQYAWTAASQAGHTASTYQHTTQQQQNHRNFAHTVSQHSPHFGVQPQPQPQPSQAWPTHKHHLAGPSDEIIHSQDSESDTQSQQGGVQPFYPSQNTQLHSVADDIDDDDDDGHTVDGINSDYYDDNDNHDNCNTGGEGTVAHPFCEQAMTRPLSLTSPHHYNHRTGTPGAGGRAGHGEEAAEDVEDVVEDSLDDTGGVAGCVTNSGTQAPGSSGAIKSPYDMFQIQHPSQRLLQSQPTPPLSSSAPASSSSASASSASRPRQGQTRHRSRTSHARSQHAGAANTDDELQGDSVEDVASPPGSPLQKRANFSPRSPRFTFSQRRQKQRGSPTSSGGDRGKQATEGNVLAHASPQHTAQRSLLFGADASPTQVC